MRRQVLVTVGTTSFDELIAVLDTPDTQLLLQRLGYTDICYQIGSSRYVIKTNILRTRVVHFEYNFEELLNESELIISHMGAGTIIDVFQHKKKALFVPNNAVSGDHQMQLFGIMHERFTATLDSIEQKLKEATETPGPFFERILQPKLLNGYMEDLLLQ